MRLVPRLQRPVPFGRGERGELSDCTTDPIDQLSQEVLELRDDRLDGGQDDDQLAGLLGNDLLIGASGSDSMTGGNGNDRLLGGSDPDVALGGDGDDTLRGQAGQDTIAAGNGQDSIDDQTAIIDELYIFLPAWIDP